MKKMETTRTMAERWNLTERRVSKLCKDGMIRGALKKGRSSIDARILFSESFRIPP